MPTIANITVPFEAAAAIAMAADPRTADDMGYVVRTALIVCMGRDLPRPFRYSREGDVIRVAGFVENATGSSTRRGESHGIDLSIDVAYSPWEVAAGQEVFLHAVACPMVRPTSGPGEARNPQVDVALGAADPDRAYAEWLSQKLGARDTGCTPLACPEIALTGRMGQVRRKTATGVSRRRLANMNSGLPYLEAYCLVRVDDVAAFGKFLVTGVGRQKAYGLGSVIPQDLVEELDL